MNSIVRLIRNEPAVVSGAVLAVISLVTAFGLDLSTEQIGSIMTVCSAIMALIIRSQVTPSIRVAAEKDKATGVDVAGEAAAPEITQNTPVDVTPATVGAETPDAVVESVENSAPEWKV